MRNLILPFVLTLFAVLLAACGAGAEADLPAEPAPVVTTVPATTSPEPQAPATTAGMTTTTEAAPATTSTTTSPLTTTTQPAIVPQDGALTVSEAVKRSLEGPATVTGFLFVSEDGTVLAEFLLESYPAQPGGSTLPVVGSSPTGFDTDTAAGVTWTTTMVEISGTLEAGVLYVESENL